MAFKPSHTKSYYSTPPEADPIKYRGCNSIEERLVWVSDSLYLNTAKSKLIVARGLAETAFRAHENKDDFRLELLDRAAKNAQLALDKVHKQASHKREMASYYEASLFLAELPILTEIHFENIYPTLPAIKKRQDATKEIAYDCLDFMQNHLTYANHDNADAEYEQMLGTIGEASVRLLFDRFSLLDYEKEGYVATSSLLSQDHAGTTYGLNNSWDISVYSADSTGELLTNPVNDYLPVPTYKVQAKAKERTKNHKPDKQNVAYHPSIIVAYLNKLAPNLAYADAPIRILQDMMYEDNYNESHAVPTRVACLDLYKDNLIDLLDVKNKEQA